MSSSETHPYHGLEEPNTNNATCFYPEEKAEGEEWDGDEYWNVASAFRFQRKLDWYVYQDELNQGTRNGKRTHEAYWTYRDNYDLIGNIADQIGTTKVEAKRARRTYFHLHGDHISGIRKDATAVAVVAYVIQQGRNDQQYHPQSIRENGQTLAEHWGEQFNLRPELITSTYGKVQHHLRISDSLSELPHYDQNGMDNRRRNEVPNGFVDRATGGGGVY